MKNLSKPVFVLYGFIWNPRKTYGKIFVAVENRPKNIFHQKKISLKKVRINLQLEKYLTYDKGPAEHCFYA